MHYLKLTLVAGSCLAVRTAAAQPSAPMPPPEPEPAPPAQSVHAAPAVMASVLPNILSTAAGATLEARADYSRLDVSLFEGDDKATLIALNFHAQYVTPRGLGGYVAVPIGHVRGEGDSATELGNLELGALYVIRGASFEAYGRVGASLDTASDDGAFLVPVANLVPRLGDSFATGFGSSWLRFGGGIRSTRGAIVAGVSGGVNVSIGRDEDQIEIPALLNLAGSVGIVQPGFGVGLGLVLYQEVGGESQSDSNIVGLNALVDVAAGPQARAYAALGVGLEDNLEGVSFGLGIRAQL